MNDMFIGISFHETVSRSALIDFRQLLGTSAVTCGLLCFSDDLSFRESYIYSDENDLEWEYEQSILGTLPSPTSKQNKYKGGLSNQSGASLEGYRNRYSIVSTSTTTSGIVSDRTCLSADNSQGN